MIFFSEEGLNPPPPLDPPLNDALLFNDYDGPTSYFPHVFDYQLSQISICQPVLAQCVNTCDYKVFVSIVLWIPSPAHAYC